MVVLDRVVVSSTEVNRRPGAVLDQAEGTPVLVTRGDGDLVIATHALVRGWLDSDARSGHLAELNEYLIRRLIHHDATDHGGPFDWLSHFDDEDLETFVAELRTAHRNARRRPSTWPLFDAVLHEWQESSIQPSEYIEALESITSQPE